MSLRARLAHIQELLESGSAGVARVQMNRQRAHGYSGQDYVRWGASDSKNFQFGAGGAPGAQTVLFEQLVKAHTLDKVPTTWNVLLLATLTMGGVATNLVEVVTFQLLVGVGSVKRPITRVISTNAAAFGQQLVQFQNIPAESIDIQATAVLQSDAATNMTMDVAALVAPVVL